MLWTLTYAVAALNRGQVVRDIGRFFAGLAVAYGDLPVLAVIERGRRGSGRLHVHIAMGGRVDHAEMQFYWGHGFVYFGDGTRCPGRCTTERLAGYLAKYLGKELDDELAGNGDRRLGEHRWQHTQGFEPEVTARRFETPEEAYEWLERLIGRVKREFTFGEAGVTFVFGRSCRFDQLDWWPGPSPPVVEG